ncbi:MAG: NusA-like transcription termination signal-binding factor [Candidatus Methanomethyliaceae archaeon]|nr:NusA-like transcription termination signal-binding factor [Candidatus Methanomethyliaceae archaeon]MDW7970326.1 NusA-like transcription termination signal-binding factor [Nitrososphaerota archaeon]
MSNIKLTADEMRYIALFETLTGAVAKDCIYEPKENRIIFVIRPGDMGLAIGKNGVNIEKAKKFIGKNIELVEYAEDPENFVKNIVAPAKVRAVKITRDSSENKLMQVTVDPKDKGIAIGKNGRNVAKARLLMKRYFDIDNVIIL